MELLGAYFVIGLLASVWVMASKPKPKGAAFSPLSFLTEPSSGWLLFLLWPIWLVIMIADRDSEVKAAPQEYLSENLVGERGEVIIELRPVGRVRVNDKLFDASSPQGTLPVGTSVIVVNRKLGELTVERTNPA